MTSACSRRSMTLTTPRAPSGAGNHVWHLELYSTHLMKKYLALFPQGIKSKAKKEAKAKEKEKAKVAAAAAALEPENWDGEPWEEEDWLEWPQDGHNSEWEQD